MTQPSTIHVCLELAPPQVPNKRPVKVVDVPTLIYGGNLRVPLVELVLVLAVWYTKHSSCPNWPAAADYLLYAARATALHVELWRDLRRKVGEGRGGRDSGEKIVGRKW
jgi:hypothetical protein